jgi:hypothetical protein
MAHPTGQNRLPSRNRDYLYIRDGKLQAIRLGRTQAGYRIRASAVELFLLGSKQFELWRGPGPKRPSRHGGVANTPDHHDEDT